MTADEVLNRFPTAKLAVAASELLNDGIWDNVRTLGPEEALRLFRETLEEEQNLGTQGHWAQALEQTYTADFQRYWIGKMGYA